MLDEIESKIMHKDEEGKRSKTLSAGWPLKFEKKIKEYYRSFQGK